MYIQVWYTASEKEVFEVEDRNLSKKFKNEILEKIVDNLNYKDLATISKVRCATVERLRGKELSEYLETKGQFGFDTVKL